jgi:Icc protein
MSMNRRAFLKTTGAGLMAAAFPISLVKLAFGAKGRYRISPLDIFPMPTFSRSREPICSQLGYGPYSGRSRSQPAHTPSGFLHVRRRSGPTGKKEELDHGLEIMSNLRGKVRYVMGEHDYYLDLGKYWQEKISPALLQL